MTVLEVIQKSTAFLEKKGVDSPRLQSELLLAHVLELPRLKLYLNFEKTVAEPQLTRLRDLVKRRGDREPLQHLLGSVSFCGLEIAVSRDALIPRPETELLALRAVELANAVPDRPVTALDFGTGTGCLAIVLAHQCPRAHVTALDVSPAALALARQNAAKHQLADRITFRQQGNLQDLNPDQKFDLIISNPPYIPSHEIPTLQPEVRDFDPRLALDGGPDGLDFYRQIAREAPARLLPQGRILLEIGAGQEEQICALFTTVNMRIEKIIKDYTGFPRIIDVYYH